MNTDIPREVLVVEDEPLVRIVATDAIADSGIMAWEAGDAAEALQVLGEHPQIGLVVTDVNMPGELDGLALAQKLTDTRSDVAVIVTSGQVHVDDEELPERSAFLPKPYRTERLVELVHRTLDGPGRPEPA
jgi:DNA-binding NtrC family response regulator